VKWQVKWQRAIARGYLGARDTSPTTEYERAALWRNIPCARGCSLRRKRELSFREASVPGPDPMKTGLAEQVCGKRRQDAASDSAGPISEGMKFYCCRVL
jgi:hypothetical protein